MKNRVSDHLKEELKNPIFRELYELDKVKTEIAKRIIAYRIKYGLTQADLAREIDVSQQQISNIEEGEFSGFKAVQRVLLGIGFKIKRIQIGRLTSQESKLVHRSNSGYLKKLAGILHTKGKLSKVLLEERAKDQGSEG